MVIAESVCVAFKSKWEIQVLKRNLVQDPALSWVLNTQRRDTNDKFETPSRFAAF